MICWLTFAAFFVAVNDDEIVSGRTHLSRGRYAEAVEAFDAVLAVEPDRESAVLGKAEALFAQGQRDAAEKLLDAALERQPGSPALLAARSQLHFHRGQLDKASAVAQAALKISPDQPLARLIQAHVWCETGKLKEANDGYRWFVRFYNRAQPADSATLMLVAEGASTYARWNSVSQVFDFTVNTLCTDALKADADCWQARAIAGELLLEKFNRGDALPELKAALAINPRAARVHLALAAAALEQLQYDEARQHARRALAVDADHPEALALLARIALQEGQIEDAASLIERSLAIQPVNQTTLALQAYLFTFSGEQPDSDRLRQLLAHLERIADWQPSPSPFERLVVQLAVRNPRPGRFLGELGKLFEQQRKFKLAEICYQQAIASMPQLPQPKTALGMLYFQTGRMDEARKLLDDAFKADPYHVRISNMRKVLKVLDDYATVTTPHFVIRVDSQLDGVLAKYMAEYLEEIYPDITQQFGYEPPQRTQIEIYNKAKGLAGHQWFSARMIGLPWLQTIGASTGLIIALTSPGATEDPFNWARVLRHEFVHIVTLQQTDFNIPHWLTEALATRAEGFPPPAQWNELLRERVAAGNLRNLDNLHLGFQRAESRDDWNFAYCQSVLYAEYFVQRFGADALPKLLNAYRTTRSTDEALQTAYRVKKSEVEAGYLEFLKQRVATLEKTTGERPRSPDEIRRDYAERPNDPEAQAHFAALQLRLGKIDAAVELAEKALQQNRQQPVAAIVVAQARLKTKDVGGAAKVAEAALQPDRPHSDLMWLAGQLRLKLDRPEAALQIFQQGRSAFPDDPKWLRGIVEAAEAADNAPILKSALETVVSIDADDLESRRKLAKMAYDAGDFARSAKFAKAALQIDVLDAEVHVLLARSFRELQQWSGALDEFGVALELKPGEADWDVEYAAALSDAGRKVEARQRLDAILKKHPDHPAARELRERFAGK